MADPLVIGLLSNKRAEVAGIIADLERQISAQRAVLMHLDATIRLFDPNARPAMIRPKGVGRPSMFEPGDISGVCMAVIRESSTPVGSREIATQLMAAKGMAVSDGKLRREVQNCVRNALSAYRRRGILEAVGTGWDTRWRLAEPKP